MIDIEPPAGPVDAMAYLTPPPDGDHGWLVRVHNRAQRIDFSLYIAGEAHAASFPTAGDALDAAVRALHIEMAAMTTRR